MKSKFMIIIFFLLLIFVPSLQVVAASPTANNITIDGNFADWSDKPFVDDNKQDIKSPWLDFSEVRYFADDKYLYLKVDRQSANKSQPWHFNVVILNAVNGQKQLQYPFGQSKPVYAPQFDVTTDYAGNKSHSGAVVNVSFNGENIENTFSASDNGKEIECRIPLEKVGLNGLNKEIQFMLKSDSDTKTGEVDWTLNERPIIITTGPTFWQLSTIFCFIAVSFAAYKVYRKGNVKHTV